MKIDKIIFLDIDGVMKSVSSTIRQGKFNGMGFCLHPEHVEALLYILEKTDARIVLSSTYRWGISVKEIKEIFAENGIPYKYVISKTPSSEDMYRGDEIAHWLESASQDAFIYHGVDLEVENYVVIDDDNDMDGIDYNRFVQTDGKYGLTFVEAYKVIELLNGKES